MCPSLYNGAVEAAGVYSRWESSVSQGGGQGGQLESAAPVRLPHAGECCGTFCNLFMATSEKSHLWLK